ncbi:hypothetical protein Agub_g12038, partial [Astrephomene gubernaculifera]
WACGGAVIEGRAEPAGAKAVVGGKADALLRSVARVGSRSEGGVGEATRHTTITWAPQSAATDAATATAAAAGGGSTGSAAAIAWEEGENGRGNGAVPATAGVATLSPASSTPPGAGYGGGGGLINGYNDNGYKNRSSDGYKSGCYDGYSGDEGGDQPPFMCGMLQLKEAALAAVAEAEAEAEEIACAGGCGGRSLQEAVEALFCRDSLVASQRIAATGAHLRTGKMRVSS